MVIFKLYLALISLLLLTGCTGSEKERGKKSENKADPQTEKPRTRSNNIIFFGNSLTAGYGLEMADAFPAIIQRKIDGLGWDFNVVNAGLSGETTASGVSRIKWVLKTPPDVFVLELGANDALRGVKLSETKSNLQSIIDTVKSYHPGSAIILAGMKAPPNLGEEYTSRFEEIFVELSEENTAPLIPFLLEGVAGEKNLNQPDGIHPTEEGQKIVAENVWEVLKPILEKIRQST